MLLIGSSQSRHERSRDSFRSGARVGCRRIARTTTLASFGAAILMVATLAHAAYKANAPQGVDLTGYWKLNTALSDDAENALQRKLEENRRDRERWMRREGMADPLGIPPIGQPAPNADSPKANEQRSRRSRNRRLQQLRDMLLITDTLSIQQSGANLQIQTEFDSRTFQAGTTSQVSMPQGELADSRVGWDGPWFVIDRRSRGPRVLEKYRWLKKTDQLESLLVWSGDGPLEGIKIRRIFDRMESAPPPPDPDRGPVR
jgi:hypothetical protein